MKGSHGSFFHSRCVCIIALVLQVYLLLSSQSLGMHWFEGQGSVPLTWQPFFFWQTSSWYLWKLLLLIIVSQAWFTIPNMEELTSIRRKKTHQASHAQLSRPPIFYTRWNRAYWWYRGCSLQPWYSSPPFPARLSPCTLSFMAGCPRLAVRDPT